MKGPLKRAQHLLRRVIGKRERPPLRPEDHVPLAGRGRVRDPGHVPESGRAPCGRPRPVLPDLGSPKGEEE